jgi:putative nucleotidyltransferase with HDIG domain
VTRPPRLVARTLAVTFLTVAAILAVVFIVLIADARARVRTSETEKLQVGGQVFSMVEATRQREHLAMIATLAENPTLKAALDTYASESGLASLSGEQEQFLRDTVAGEAAKLAALTSADVVAIVDASGRIFVSAGPASDRWPAGQPLRLPAASSSTFDTVVALPGGVFRVSGAALTLGGDRDVGTLLAGTSLDEKYARELAARSGAGVVITVNGTVVAKTVPDAVTAALTAGGDQSGGMRELAGEEYAIRPLFEMGPARVYALSSIDAAARDATRSRLIALGSIAAGAFVLAALVSLWLARTLSDPINRLSSEIEVMTAAHDFTRTLTATGSSRELDALAGAFNQLMHGLTAAEAESRAAYLGAIRALAAALDARDPYTAGHSERVSAYSVMIGRGMKLADSELDVLRLGALLHDIGKIGLSDEVLRKPAALTPDEYEQIKRHPGLGARILRQVPFLAPHIPIVELHHERPDGRGYPYGLRADDIPVAARIVHVADAFDAMTSARAYRPARGRAEAAAELQRHSGTQFDAASVEALLVALPSLSEAPEPALQELLGRRLA